MKIGQNISCIATWRALQSSKTERLFFLMNVGNLYIALPADLKLYPKRGLQN
nr:MAG TPA: hypothetical protein [Caudoviricetes sp.]